MSQYTDGPTRTFTASAALAPHLRVKLTSGKTALAGAADIDIGTVEGRAYADGNLHAVRLRNAPGTRKMVAAGAIAEGADVYAAASGKIDDEGTIIVGTALEEATADGDVIEVLPLTVQVTTIEEET